MDDQIFFYNAIELRKLIATIIKEQIEIDQYNWLEGKASLIDLPNNISHLYLSFSAIPRKIGKKIIKINADQKSEIESILPGVSFDDWPLQRLCRIWLVMHVNADKENAYCKAIENLFQNAEMNELADMYAALPLLAWPEAWVQRCTEGIRSNIGIVLEAIMYHNPYPSQFLNESAWNQLILKAFFTDKDVNRIVGQDARANQKLASTLIDYAHERYAAKRPVNNQLWRLVGRFIDETIFPDIQNLFTSNDVNIRKAAALACYQSNFEPAKNLLNAIPDFKTEILENKLNWLDVSS